MIYEVKLQTITLKIKEQCKDSSKITCSDKAIPLLKRIYNDLDDDQEYFVCLFLNSQNQIRGYKILFAGGQNSTCIDLKVLFRNVLLFGAAAIILAHNHPCNNAEPSADDLKINPQISKIAKLLEISFLDHIIITKTDAFSFADHDLMNKEA